MSQQSPKRLCRIDGRAQTEEGWRCLLEAIPERDVQQRAAQLVMWDIAGTKDRTSATFPQWWRDMCRPTPGATFSPDMDRVRQELLRLGYPPHKAAYRTRTFDWYSTRGPRKRGAYKRKEE